MTASRHAPRERPILFSAPMVRAILDGRKTQTRRVVAIPEGVRPGYTVGWSAFTPPDHVSVRGSTRDGEVGEWFVRNRYGDKGDRLWVKETFACAPHGDDAIVAYRATCEDDSFDFVHRDGAIERLRVGRWTPSIFMPRWASRITLEVTGVRVERVQDISEEDARAEGVLPYDRASADQRVPGPGFNDVRLGDQPHRLPFADLWESINGAESWAANPWVWVVEFRRVAP